MPWRSLATRTVRSEHVLWFLVSLACIHLFIILLLPRGATGIALANLDPVQVQMLIDSYRDQLTFFKIAAGTVCGAETSAIIWLTKRLLDEMKRRR